MDNFFFGKPKGRNYDYNKHKLVRAEDICKKYIDEQDEKYVFLKSENSIFAIGGIKKPSENYGEYYRLDASKKNDYTDANRSLAMCTPGASLRFYTTADHIFLKVKYRNCLIGMHHFCDRGVYGFDMYTGNGTDRAYCGAMMQTFAEDPKESNSRLNLPTGGTELMIEYPLYGGVESVSIGIPKGALIGKPAPRKVKPVAFYGSSITQGGCVSRPGTMYSNILCRAVDCDNFNLGFSGSAFGEQYSAEWIASLDLSCFVMDYDYNSRSLEELQNTHLPFYETVRKSHKDMPIIIVSHPCFWDAAEGDFKKRDICKATYDMAKQRGDNVYFVDGCDFFPSPMKDLFCVDNLHPNDLGHYYMAKAIYPVLAKALKG